jgi:phage terminase small subunit
VTPKQQLFVAEYLIDLNATQAAIRAGYSKKTARQVGQQNLSKLVISQAIAEATAAKMAEVDISSTRVLQELGKLSFFDVRKLFNADGSPKALHELDDDTASAIAGFEVVEMFEGVGDERKSIGVLKKFRLADKGQNLERLGRYHKLFVDRVEHAGSLKISKELWDSVLND